MCSLVGACSGLGCPAAAAAGAVLRWPEEAPEVLPLLGGSAWAHNSWLWWLRRPSKHQQRREDCMDEGLNPA